MNKKFVVIIVCSISFLFPVKIFATYQDSISYRLLPEKFMEILKEKGSDKAIDFLFTTNEYLRLKLANNLKIKNELKNIIVLLGKNYGYELIDEKKVGNNYVVLYYLAHYDRQPLLFIFTMYKPNKKWRVQQLQFSEKLSKYIKGDL